MAGKLGLEDSNADVATIVDLVDSDSGRNSSSTYCITKYFGNGPDNGDGNGNGSGVLADSDLNHDNDNSNNHGNDNNSIQTKLDDIINNDMGKINSQSSKSRNNNLMDDDATRVLGSSMPLLMPLGLDLSIKSTDSYYAADGKNSKGPPLGAPGFHVEGLEQLEESSRHETNGSMYVNDSDESFMYLSVLPDLVDHTSDSKKEFHVNIQEVLLELDRPTRRSKNGLHVEAGDVFFRGLRNP